VSTVRRDESDRTASTLVVLAAVWTFVMTAIWLFLPASRSTSVSSSSSGETTSATSTETLLESEGTSVLLVLAVPVVLVGIALLTRRSRHARRLRLTTGGLLFAAGLLGAASIGLFYLPAAVLLLVAGARTGAHND
jgi:hypothetical protein